MRPSNRDRTVEESAPAEGANARILVVDDHEPTVLAVRGALEQLGEEIVSAGSGREALALLLQEDFAVVLLDVKLPDMEGFEVAALVRERNRSRHTPILFLTGYLDSEFATRAYALGAVDVLYKPILPAVLRAKVATFVALDRQAGEIRRLNETLEQRVKERSAALRGSEERFRILIEGAKDHAIVGIDPLGRITDWNAGAARLLGYEENEIVGKPAATIFTPEQRQQGVPQRELDEAMRAGHASDERWHVRKDGSRFWGSGMVTPLWNEAGQLTGFVKVFRDRTAERAIEESLRESEERFRSTFANASIGMALTGMDGRFVQVNDAFCRITGYSREELNAVDLVSLTYPDDRARKIALTERMLAGKIPSFVIEKRYRKKNGRVVWVRNSVSLARDANGQPAHLIVLTENITRRRRMQRALRESEAEQRRWAAEAELGRKQLYVAIDNLVQGLMLVDRNARFVMVNQAAAELHGFTTPEEMASVPMRELMSMFETRYPDGRPLPPKDWPTARAFAGETVSDFEIHATRRDTGKSWIGQYNVAPVRDESGQVIQIVITIDDLTERKRAHEVRVLIERQLMFLVEASGSLLASPHATEVLTTLIDLAQRSVEADAYAVWRKQGAPGEWKRVISHGLSENYEDTVNEGDAGASSMPSEMAVVEDIGKAPLVAYRAGVYAAEGIQALLAVPLRIQGAIGGTIVFYYRSPHRFSESEKRIATALGNLAAAALGTAELYDRQSLLRAAAQADERRAAFLAEAGEILGSSLGYEQTLRGVAEAAVPAFADWCGVDVLSARGELQRLAVKHTDPEKVRFALEIAAKYPPLEGDTQQVALATGQAMMLAEIPERLIDVGARDAEHARLIRELGLRSYIVAPLCSHGRVLGALTFATAESGRRYTAADFELAKELARRAATAVENAQLHRNVLTSEERYRSLVQATTSIVWTADPEGQFIEPQASWEASTGQSWEEHKGFGWVNAIHPEDREEMVAVWVRSRAEQRTYAAEGRLWHAPTQEYRYFIARATPVRNTDGTIREWIGTCTDVHAERLSQIERDEALSALEQANEALRRANHDLEQFAYSASHDLQEPLRMVSIFTQLLRRRYGGKLDADADEYIGHAVRGATRMERLVRDLLTYIQVSKTVARPGALADAEAALQRALENLEVSVQQSGAKVECGPLPRVRMADIHLQQIFQNLIGNAIKYKTADCPRIQVRAVERDGFVEFAVEDNGIGIDPQYSEQVFGIFKRLHGATEYEGTGIGLAICATIVERYGGRIWVESSAGKGSTFLFTVPADQVAS
jgi:PAS domain S-box-containing protein